MGRTRNISSTLLVNRVRSLGEVEGRRLPGTVSTAFKGSVIRQ